MKKIFSILAVVLFSSLAFSELYPFKRYVELSITSETGASNNTLTITDYLVKNPVFDIKKITKDVPSDGFKLNANIDTNVALNINTKGLRFSLYNRVEGTVNVGIDKSVFEYICEGNLLTKKKSFDIDCTGDIYNSTGISVFAKLFGFGITVAPEIYIPVLYIPKVPIKAEIDKTGSGMKVYGSADVVTYSAVDIDNMSSFSISDTIGNSGFALGVALEKRVYAGLDVGGYFNIPLAPGKLSYKRSQKVTFDMTVDNILGSLDDKDAEPFKTDFSTDDPVVEKVSQKVFKPLRFGVEAAYRPFGYWFTVRGLFGLGIRNPYDPDERIVYPEYNLGLDLSLFKILEGSISTSYKNKVFAQSIGLVLNFRVIEIDAKLVLQAQDFASSFRLTGAGAYVGFKIGF